MNKISLSVTRESALDAIRYLAQSTPGASWGVASNMLVPAAPPTTAEVEHLRAEVSRLTHGLDFYAKGHHFDLPDWDAPDEPNWLCPTDDENDGKPWMVENGSTARAVLAGGRMGMRRGESCIVMPYASPAALAGFEPLPTVGSLGWPTPEERMDWQEDSLHLNEAGQAAAGQAIARQIPKPENKTWRMVWGWLRGVR